MRRLPVALAVLAIATAGCGSGDPTVSRPRSTATIAILEPAPGQTFSSGDVPVRLRLRGGRITRVVTTNIKPDTGHVHIRVDGVTITLLGSLQQTVHKVKKGPHILEAEFVAADHAPFDPRVLTSTSFSVK